MRIVHEVQGPATVSVSAEVHAKHKQAGKDKAKLASRSIYWCSSKNPASFRKKRSTSKATRSRHVLHALKALVAGIEETGMRRQKMHKTAICKRCDKQGDIELESGHLPEPYVLRRLGWYWSDRDNCFYCMPCSNGKVAESLDKIVDLCEKHGTEVKIM